MLCAGPRSKADLFLECRIFLNRKFVFAAIVCKQETLELGAALLPWGCSGDVPGAGAGGAARGTEAAGAAAGWPCRSGGERQRWALRGPGVWAAGRRKQLVLWLHGRTLRNRLLPAFPCIPFISLCKSFSFSNSFLILALFGEVAVTFCVQ